MPRCYFCKARNAVTPETTWVREDDHVGPVPMCHTGGHDCWYLFSVYLFTSPEQVTARIKAGANYLRQYWDGGK